MTTFSASVRADDGMLHTSRPLTAPEAVSDMIEQLVYAMTAEGGGVAAGVTAVELMIETSGESETPIGDSVSGTSSTPLTAADDDETVTYAAPAPATAGSQS